MKFTDEMQTRAELNVIDEEEEEEIVRRKANKNNIEIDQNEDDEHYSWDPDFD